MSSLTQPRILVLLACRNGAPWISEQVHSILAQREIDLRIVVSDDASSDGTVELVRQLQAQDSRITLLAAPVPSGSAGNNFRRLIRDVDSSGFDFVALSDQDDIWDEGKLTAAVQSLRNTGASGYSCSTRSVWKDGREKTILQSRTLRGADFLFEGGGQGCTFVLRNDLFGEIQRFCRCHVAETDALHFHDWLIYLLARAWKRQWHFDPAAWIRYRQHENNEIGSRGNWRSVTARLKNIRNGWYSHQIAAALKIASVAAPEDDMVRTFNSIFTQQRSWRRRSELATFFLIHGRRRLIDRTVMSVAAALGWI